MDTPDPMGQAASTLDQRVLRRALGNFVTGVTVVTTADAKGAPRGLTANSFTSVSLDPPLVLVCIANTSSSLAAFQQCEGFAINILSEEQRSVSEIFSSRVEDRFKGIAWRRGATGAPAIDGSLATLDCTVYERIPAGDHLILVGRVMDHRIIAGRPLVYGQGGYVSVSIQQAAVSQPRGREVMVSCIAEHAGRVLLTRTGDAWTLPRASLSGDGERDLVPLMERFQRLGVDAEITFLYSVFESTDPPIFHVVYRGELRSIPKDSPDIGYFDETNMPWGALAPAQLRGMLRRFFRESAVDQFGIYSDVAEGGRVARLHRDTESFDRYLSQLRDH